MVHDSELDEATNMDEGETSEETPEEETEEEEGEE